MCSDKCRLVIKIIVTSVLIGILVRSVDWIKAWEYIREVQIGFVALFIFFYCIGILISAKKWQVLARVKNFKQPYFFYVKTYLLGTFLNNFFPSFVGGDAYRVYSLGGKVQKNTKASSAVIIIDRVSGLVVIVCLASLFGILNYKTLQANNVIIVLIILFSIISSIFISSVVFFETYFVKKLVKSMPSVIAKYIVYLSEFRSRKILPSMISYSIFFAFTGIILANYMLFIAVGVEVSFLDFISVIFLTNIIASVPLSIGNIGIKEWAYIFLFSVFSIHSSAVVAVVVIARVLQVVISLLAVPLYISSKRKVISHK